MLAHPLGACFATGVAAEVVCARDGRAEVFTSSRLDAVPFPHGGAQRDFAAGFERRNPQIAKNRNLGWCADVALIRGILIRTC